MDRQNGFESDCFAFPLVLDDVALGCPHPAHLFVFVFLFASPRPRPARNMDLSQAPGPEAPLCSTRDEAKTGTGAQGTRGNSKVQSPKSKAARQNRGLTQTPWISVAASINGGDPTLLRFGIWSCYGVGSLEFSLSLQLNQPQISRSRTFATPRICSTITGVL